MIAEIKQELLEDIGLNGDFESKALSQLERGESRYVKDLRINFKNVLKTDHLSEKEVSLLGLSLAVNEKNEILRDFFTKRAESFEATEAEMAEAVACASLLSSNNVLYRFRHFTQKEKYEELPARIKMNIMMRPETGKEFFELMSLAISAVNGCEMCVKSHEASLMELGSSEERVWEAIKLASVITSYGKIIH